MFSWMMTNFHCFGWTQLISRFLRIQNDFSYKCFYEALFDFIRNQNESKLIFDQYNITKKRITKYLNHGDIDINLRNELGFEMKFVGHNLIYASQMVFRHHHQQTMPTAATVSVSAPKRIPTDRVTGAYFPCL